MRLSVSLLLASPLARGLFHGAIAQSGGMFEPLQLAPGFALEAAEKDGQTFAIAMGAANIADLRDRPAQDFLDPAFYKSARPTHPVIDRYVVPRGPYQAYAEGLQNDVPVLVGSNADEARSLVADVSKIRAASFAEDIARSFGPLPAALIEAYPHATDADAVSARLAFERDLRFGWDMWAWARLHAAHSRTPVYYYHFDRAPPFPRESPYGGWGAGHFVDLWYMSDHLDQDSWAWTDDDRRLARDMSQYWVNFARTGNPNGGALVTWPSFDHSERVLYLGSSIRVGGVANRQALSAFDRVYDSLRGSAEPKRAP